MVFPVTKPAAVLSNYDHYIANNPTEVMEKPLCRQPAIVAGFGSTMARVSRPNEQTLARPTVKQEKPGENPSLGRSQNADEYSYRGI